MKRLLGDLLLFAVMLVLVFPSALVCADEHDLTEDVYSESVEVETDEESAELEVYEAPVLSLANSELELNETDDEEVLGGQSDIKISKVQTGVEGDGRDEFVELYNSSNEKVSLADMRLDYLSSTHGGGESATRVLKRFGTVEMAPFSYLVVFSSSYPEDYAVPGDGQKTFFDSNYAADSGQIASNGSVRLVTGAGEVLDLVGWGSASQAEYRAVKGMSFSRCVDRDSFVMVDTDNNLADFYDGAVPFAVVFCAGYEDAEVNWCVGLKLSEIGANLTRQFIELRNTGKEELDVTDCQIKTNRNAKVYVLPEIEMGAGEFLTLYIEDMGLTLTKTTSGTVQLLSSSGEVVDETSYGGLKSGTSWAKFGGTWKQTYLVTPDQENIWQEFAPCEVGYERNLETGRCKKVVEEKAVEDCGEGRYRNPETGRCKKYELPVILAPCRDGYYRNPETNRCKKLAALTAALSPCPEGWERNPETNRCRKVRENTGADYGVLANTVSDKASFAGWWTLGGIGIAGVMIVGWQFRDEIRGGIKKVFQKVSGKR